MENIVWDDSLKIGHAEIDEQHRKWVQLFNELETMYLSRDIENITEIIDKTVEEIYDYTSYHFAAEEKLMREAGYPEIIDHWRTPQRIRRYRLSKT